jgi:hypothetical protein
MPLFNKRSETDDYRQHQSAQVLLLADRIVMHPWGYPGPQYGPVFTPPVIRLPLSVSALQFADAMRTTLNSSMYDVRLPNQYSDYVRPLYDAAEVDSWLQLQQVAQSVGLNLTNDFIDITPSHNGGTRGEDSGFSPLQELAVRVSVDVPDAEFARIVRDAFRACSGLCAA